MFKRFVLLVVIATLGTWIGINPAWAAEGVDTANPVDQAQVDTTVPASPGDATPPTDPNLPITTQPPTPLDGVPNESETAPSRYPPATASAPRPTKTIQTDLNDATTTAYATQATALASQSIMRGLRAQGQLLDKESDALDARITVLREKLNQQTIAWYLYDPTYAHAEQANLESITEMQQAARIEQITAASLETETLALRDFEKSKSALDATATELTKLINTNDAQNSAANDTAESNIQRVTALRAELAAANEGYSLSSTSFVFPAGAPYSYWDSWHAPRMVGTASYHEHVGTDVLGEWWLPLYAIEGGTVGQIGTNTLGGNRIWLYGDSGTDYYYAHLVDWPKDLKEGQRVKPGDVIGYMGDSGNSVGGPVHLHIQIHPNGGEPVNPYPILAAVDVQRRPPNWRGSALP